MKISLKGSLATLEAALHKVPLSEVVSAYTASVIGDPVVVQHKLNAVPDCAFDAVESDMRVWATADDKKLWTSTQVVVRGSAADEPFSLLLVKF